MKFSFIESLFKQLYHLFRIHFIQVRYLSVIICIIYTRMRKCTFYRYNQNRQPYECKNLKSSRKCKSIWQWRSAVNAKFHQNYHQFVLKNRNVVEDIQQYMPYTLWIFLKGIQYALCLQINLQRIISIRYPLTVAHILLKYLI